jgi:hypothetical protein
MSTLWNEADRMLCQKWDTLPVGISPSNLPQTRYW